MRFVLLFFIFIFYCISCTSGGAPLPRPAAASVAVVEGGAVFRQYCVLCHGADGKLGLNGARDLSRSVLPLEERVQVISNGRNLMTPFKELLSEAEIRAVAEYTMTLREN